MKKFFAILMVALLATSYAFSADGTGTVNVTVTHPTIVCNTQPHSLDWAAVPNSTQAIDWTWEFQGACGVAFSTPTYAWTNLGSWFTEAAGATLTPAGIFDGSTGKVNIQYQGTMNCLAGTPATTYALTLTVTVNY